MEMIESSNIASMFSIKVKEQFFKCMTLEEYLNDNSITSSDLKKLIFQVIYTLAILQNEYPGFRHNLLSPNNIYIYQKRSSNKIDRYESINSKNSKSDFYVPDSNFDIKITNFFGACIPKLYCSDMVIPFIDEKKPNDYLDLHYFLNCIMNMKSIKDLINGETLTFLKKVIPRDTISKKSLYLKKYVELYKPVDLLQDEYFSEYMKVKEIVDPMVESDYYMGTEINSKSKSKSKSKFTNTRVLTKKNYNNNTINLLDDVSSQVSNNILQGGGNKYYKPPIRQVKNSPFLSNENRRINTMNQQDNMMNDEPAVKKNEKHIIAAQEIATNPNYIKPFKIKEKPTFDRSHETVEPKHFIPQSKPLYQDTMKEYTPPYKPYEKKSYDKPYEKKSYDKPYEKKSYDKPYEKSKSEFYKPMQQANITDQPILAEQKVYQAALPAPGNVGHTHPKYTNPSFISLDNNMTYPPAFVPEAANYFPYMRPLERKNEIPLQQIYQINLGNPTVHTNALNKIYEDTLPGDPYTFTMSSIYERNHLINFLRNSMNIASDGDEMTMQAGKKSLMEFIKIIDFNPYTIGKNKYATIPMDFLIYNAAYPIRYNVDTRQIDIAKYSIGMNIRMYNMSVGASIADQTGVLGISKDNFDLWRDIKFYQHIKTDIIDTKVCPNFITLFLYKLDKVSAIDYTKLYSIITKHIGVTPIERELALRSQVNNALTPFYLNKLASGSKAPRGTPINLDSSSGDSMIVITEAPTCNLIEWGSPIYKNQGGAVNNMISTGFHSSDIWKSVLFQLAYSIAVLQEHSIYIRDFSIENNVFIKDLFANSNNLGHWEYRVGDVNFYIPNFGYLVLIDTRYKTVDLSNLKPGPVLPLPIPVPNVTLPVVSPGVITRITPFTRYYKIESTIYNNNYGSDIEAIPAGNRDSKIKELIQVECFQKIFTNFNGFLTTNQMAPVNQEILNLITQLSNIPMNTSIKDYLITCFPDFLHNRVGTLLTKTERDVINPSVMPIFSNIKGNVIAYQSRFDEYKWAVYLGPVLGNNKKKLIYEYDRNTNTGMKKEIFNHSIVYYPDPENVLQVGDRAIKLNKDSLIEKYSIV